MNIIKINPQNPDLEIIKKAVQIIKNGGIIVYPTDTCYGIGASAFDKKAIKNVFLIKGRNFNKPLSIITRNLNTAKSIAYINKKQEQYFQRKLPGSYTLIFKKKKILPDILTANQNKIGIRIPNYLITQLIIEELIIPYTTTSANISGQISCYSIKDFLNQIKDKNYLPDLILDAGILPKNKLSTIIDLINNIPKIIRE